MGWKIVRNDQSQYKEVSYSGECPRFHKQATVTGGYYGRLGAKTDLQLTYTLSGYSCTLERSLCPMASQCPLMPEKYL
jgi:hypothetical protein